MFKPGFTNPIPQIFQTGSAAHYQYGVFLHKGLCQGVHDGIGFSCRGSARKDETVALTKEFRYQQLFAVGLQGGKNISG